MPAILPRNDQSRTAHLRRGGFTLLELMLVLAIIATIAAIISPRLSEVFERQKLKGAANELRLEWDRARLQAMRTGQAQVFECELSTNNYTVKPLVLQSDASDAGAGATVMTGGALAETTSQGFLTAADTSDEETQQLDEKISFVTCVVAADMRAYSLAQDSQTEGLNDISTQTVGQKVVFYPDGSTSTAEVRIQNSRGDMRAVRMRGLTGHSQVVSISNVASNSEDN